MRKTSLHTCHLALQAKMVPFAGFEMPVQYTGVVREHHAVREHAGLFDVSHMGRVFDQWACIVPLIQHVFSNDVELISDKPNMAICLMQKEGLSMIYSFIESISSVICLLSMQQILKKIGIGW